MSPCVHAWEFHLGEHRELDVLGHEACQFIIFQDTGTRLFKVVIPIYTPSNSVEKFLTAFEMFCIVRL